MYHECSDEELGAFKDPTSDAKWRISNKIEIKQKMFCFDWIGDREKLSLWGSWQSSNHRYISIMLVPCNYVPKGFEDLYQVSEDCIKDEKAQRDYLKTHKLHIYATD